MRVLQDIQSISQTNVKIKTCADVYNFWRTKKRLYKRAPKDGIEFQVDYIDTGLSLSEERLKSAPVVLALHGAPGSYHDFSLLIKHLSLQNVRVIAPNFPEYVATVQTKVLFRHSADEKAAYLRDFLRAINVNKIDLLVSHSSAIFPSLIILMNGSKKALTRQKQHQKEQSENGAEQLKKSIEENHNGVIVLTGTDIIQNKCSATKNAKHLNTNMRTAPDKDNLEADQHSLGTETDTGSECSTSSSSSSSSPSTDSQQSSSTTSSIAAPSPAKKNPTKARKLNKREVRAKQVIVKFDDPIEIKSIALLNPAGHRLPMSMKPTWFKCGSVRIYQHKIGRSLFRKLGPAFLTVVGVPVRVDNMDNVMLSATVMRNSKCPRVVQQLKQLSEMKLPTLLVFSENDKLIEKEIFYEMSDFMNLNTKNFDIFNNEGDIELSRKYLARVFSFDHICSWSIVISVYGGKLSI